MTARTTRAAKTAKPKPPDQQPFEPVLLDWLADITDRINAGDDLAGLAEQLHATGHPLADIAITAAAPVLTEYETALASGDSNATHARMLVIGQLYGPVEAAVTRAQADQDAVAQLEAAQAELAAIGKQREETLAAFETAVEQADEEAIVRARVRLENVLPGKLAAARVAEVKARKAVEQSTVAAAERLTAAAEQRRANAGDEVDRIRAELDAAALASQRAAIATVHITSAAGRHDHVTRELDAEIDRLTNEADAGKQRRMRLALDDTEESALATSTVPRRLDQTSIGADGRATTVTCGFSVVTNDPPKPQRVGVMRPSAWQAGA